MTNTSEWVQSIVIIVYYYILRMTLLAKTLHNEHKYNYNINAM